MNKYSVMKAVWKISGEFYGWISENGSFYSTTGKRTGTFLNNILFNYKGKYCGEMINEDFIGCDIDRMFLEGPECHLTDEIYLEPLHSKVSYEAHGFVNPK